jgi:integrase
MRVRIVGIKRFVDHTGKLRLYYRRKGAPSVSIDPTLSGAALVAKVAELDRRHLSPSAKGGTLRHLVGDYKAKSNHWRVLRTRTRKDYERVFAWLGAALDAPLTAITSPAMAATRDKARDQHEPKFANQVVTSLKMVFRHGVEHGMMRENPCLGLSKATGGNKRENRPCAAWEAAALLHHAPANLLPGIALGLYCGIREGDVTALPANAVIGDWIEFRQGTPGRAHAAPLTGDLRAILSQIPAHDATTLLISSTGRPWTLEGFKTAWGRYRDKLVEAELIRPGVTFHGLRHTGATILAEMGYEEAQIRHFLGHGPRTISGHYAKSAKRRALVWEMGETVARVIREARGNVVRLGN